MGFLDSSIPTEYIIKAGLRVKFIAVSGVEVEGVCYKNNTKPDRRIQLKNLKANEII